MSISVGAMKAATGTMLLIFGLASCDSIQVPTAARTEVIGPGDLLYEAEEGTQGETSRITLIMVIRPTGPDAVPPLEREIDSLRHQGWKLQHLKSGDIAMTSGQHQSIAYVNTVRRFLSLPSTYEDVVSEIRSRFSRTPDVVVVSLEPCEECAE